MTCCEVNACLHSAVRDAARMGRAPQSRRPVILVFVNLYLPGFHGGGPVRSIANLVEALGDEFDFRIVTADRDINDKSAYPGIAIGAWNRVGKARVYYADKHALGWFALRRLLRETPYDLVYLNSYFHATFSLKPLLLRWLHQTAHVPLVIAPRGEFSPGAIAIKSWRKHLFIALAHCAGWYRGARWQASTSDEIQDIHRVTGAPQTAILEARNLVATSGSPPKLSRPAPAQNQAGRLRVCFLSRISEKKNLDFALRVLAQASTPIDFDIYGPTDDQAYWSRCQTLIAALPANVSARYGGAVRPEQVRATIAAYDILFVPTKGENFGHVFIEAWSAGVPVLISDCTPWRDLHDKRLGWDLPLAAPDAFVQALASANAMSAEETSAVRQSCVAFASTLAGDTEAIAANRQLFRHALCLA